jgi:hypothetical protein
MTQPEKRHASLLCWNGLTLEQKFYKVIEWLKAQKRDTTERHPNDLTGREIQEIWHGQTF